MGKSRDLKYWERDIELGWRSKGKVVDEEDS